MKKHLGAALGCALSMIGGQSCSSEVNPPAGINLLNRLVQERIVGLQTPRPTVNPIPVPRAPQPASASASQQAAAPENADGTQQENSAAQINDLMQQLNDVLAQNRMLESKLTALEAGGSDRQTNMALTDDLGKAGAEIASLKKQIADLQAQKVPPKNEAAGAAPRMVVNDSVSGDVRASYAVGAWYGDSAPQETKKFNSIGRKLDLQAFSQGFQDRIDNRMQLSQSARDAELASIAKLLDSAMLSQNQKQSKAVMEKAAKENGAIRTPDGAVYIILNSGRKPLATDQSNIEFELDEELATGEVLASGEKGGGNVKDLPPLFQTVVKKLGVGGSAKMYVPGEQVYGESGIPGVVPPGALSIMTLKVVDIK